MSRAARCGLGCLAMVLCGTSGRAADAPKLEVSAAAPVLNVAVAAPCNLTDSAWCLKRDGQAVPAAIVPAIEADGQPAATARDVLTTLSADKLQGTSRWTLEPAAKQAGGFSFCERSPASLQLNEGDQPVLVYNHGTITNESVPKNDPRRSRACFVHPVYGLSGEVLTDSFPKDHYHHHGIFWAWPHVQIDGKEYDLWACKNIRQKQLKWLGRQVGPAAAVLGMENGWFVDDKQVATERVWLRVYRAEGDARAIDLSIVLVPCVKMTLWGAPQKSYGGLSLRYAPRQETLITVPTGRTKEDLPDTQLAWADLSAKFSGATSASGAAIFVPPAHPNFPPTWLTRHYGILCVGWPGVKPKEFEPNTPVRLDYRVWIHKSLVTPEALATTYEGYKAALAAKWAKP